MRAFLLLCSLLGLTIAQNNVGLFASTAGTAVTSDALISFPYTINGVSKTHITISKYGAVFPDGTSGFNPSNAVPAYSTVGYSVLGPLWSNAYFSNPTVHSGDNAVTYSIVVKDGSESSTKFFNTWAPMVNNLFNPDHALIVTWWRMENSDGSQTASFQLIILSDNSNAVGATYVFHLYGEITWYSKNNFAPGFSLGSAALSYESSYAGLSKVQSTQGKAGQSNFFYKISTSPFVDVHLTSDGTHTTTPSSQYIGISFTPSVTSHGATAFNFFKPANINPSLAPIAFAPTSSTLVCFTSEYTGDPSQVTSAHHFAQSNSAGLSGVWEFPANHVFVAETTYYCYCSSPVSSPLVVVPAGHKRSFGTSFISSGSPATFGAAGVNYAYQFATILFATAKGDPIFKSLRTGDSFNFGGEAGKHFNLYHDRYVNLNAEFAYANAAKKEGTIISKVGVLVGGHKVSFGVEDFATGSIQINLDGKSVKLYNDKVHLSGCVDIHYLSQWSSFYIVSPTHKLKFTLDERHSEHMNGKFIDITVEDVPEAKADVESLGGVIGQTIKAGPINTNADDFAVSGLFSVEKSNYKAAEFEDCA